MSLYIQRLFPFFITSETNVIICYRTSSYNTHISTKICTSVGLYLDQGVVKTLTNLQSLDKLPYYKYIFYNWLAVVSCGPCGLPPSIAYGEGWSGQWLCAGPHPANTYSPPPLRPRVHTYTGSQRPCRSVKKVPRAILVASGRADP